MAVRRANHYTNKVVPKRLTISKISLVLRRLIRGTDNLSINFEKALITVLKQTIVETRL